IIGPVKGIERMINRLGEGRSLGNTVTFTGPRELRSVGQRIIWRTTRSACTSYSLPQRSPGSLVNPRVVL
ncbi:hypothetical protein MJI37_28465, partial [Salmonella enterica subsp. enterica serovar Cerro]|nr:hypothetical protein [Salmonella enterica subsp. enterica serovar Cerro]